MFFITREDLLRYKHIPLVTYPNKRNIPVNTIAKDHIDEWNDIVDYLESLDLHKLEFNQSGSFKTAMDKPRWPAYGSYYDIQCNTNCMYAILQEGMFCWSLSNYNSENLTKDESGNIVKPVDEYKEMLRIFKDSGFNLKYARTSDYEKRKLIKAEIEKQMVECRMTGVTIKNAHHLDYNSSFILGACEDYPELWDTCYNKYEERLEYKHLSKEEGDIYDIKQNQIKNMFTHFIGGCRSDKPPFWLEYVKLGKSAINNNNKRLRKLSDMLENSGRTIIAYNTDGIWYTGDIYHDDNEGEHLGQWKTDYANCTIRFKSDGAYEFIDDKGKLHIKVRGLPESKRQGMVWGDIFRTNIVNTKIIIGRDCRAIEIEEVISDD